MDTQEARSAYPELVKAGADAEWNVTGRLRCDYTTTSRQAHPTRRH